MARKKIVFIIVEGPSDQDALGLLFDHIFDRSKVYVHVVHGDITSQTGNNSSNILKKVTDEIRSYAQNYHWQKIHFQQVIHIVDMDGAYAPVESIKEDVATNQVLYFVDSIVTRDRQALISRNRIKRQNLDKLSETPTIWGGVPYSVYYMSCNLDHVLYDKLNLSDEEKEVSSYHFAQSYRSDVEGFRKFITQSDFSVDGDYLSTWKYIKDAKHSLERHTNLGLCFTTYCGR